ncbi:MAG TPA: hypothetical protein VGD56_10845 [Gemmatirosa sp.]
MILQSDVVDDARFQAAEYATRVVFSWLRLGVETVGALVIAATSSVARCARKRRV